MPGGAVNLSVRHQFCRRGPRPSLRASRFAPLGGLAARFDVSPSFTQAVLVTVKQFAVENGIGGLSELRLAKVNQKKAAKPPR